MMGSLLLTCVHYSAFSTQIPNGRLTRPDSSGLLVRASRLNHLQLLCISALLVALVFGKRQFAQANVGGGDFDQLIFLNVLKRLLERHLARGLEDDVLIAAGGAHVGELLGLGGVDDDVVLAAMLAADLAFVAGFAVLDEEDAAVLERVERIAVDGAGHVADHRSVGAAADLAAHGRVFVEVMMHDGGALRGRERAGAEADESARGDGEFQVDLAGAVVHADELTAAVTDELHYAAQVFLGDVDDEVFDGFERGAIVAFSQDHVRLADGELIAFAAHVFDEDAQVQQAATADFEGVLAIGLFDLEGDVALEFLPEALAQIAAGNA